MLAGSYAVAARSCSCSQRECGEVQWAFVIARIVLVATCA